MSDLPPPTSPFGRENPEAGSGRSTSVDLREGADAAGPDSLMDPAAKSLNDALKITYRLLQLAMVVLLGLFLLSGFQSVNQGERAVRLLFGKKTGGDLGPGFQWSAPHPFGELVTVQTAAPLVVLDTQFWPSLTPEEKKMTREQLSMGGRDSLDPVTDGSVITADGFVAHVQAQVKYRRDDPAQYLQSLETSAETSLVTAAVRRGVVRAAAQLTMDRLMANDGAERIAQTVAQETLDQARSGLTIEQLTFTGAMPPRAVGKNYDLPLSAESQRVTAMQEALAERAKILNEAAGPAAELVLKQIDLCEEQLRLGNKPAAEAIQATIDRLLVGEPVEINGETVNPPVFGQVKQLLEQARLERTQIVSTARSDADRFRVIRQSYSSNPGVVLTGEWTAAFNAFLKRPTVQVQSLPPDAKSIVLMINRDPNLSKEQYEAYLRQENARLKEEARKRRERELLERKVDTTPMTPQ